MLEMSESVYLEIVAEAWRGYPLEVCGLLAGVAGSDLIEVFYPIHNAAESSRVFSLDGLGHMKAERAADEAGLEIMGILHSHTHSQAYPSPTDVAEATKPLVPSDWRWLIISLEHGLPELRSFRVIKAQESREPEILEESLVLVS